MRDVAVIAFAQTKAVRRETGRNETEMLMEVVGAAFEQAGMPERRADFTCSGSSDYLSGLPFSFVFALDAVGGWPPIAESHLEMDGAFALFEAWVRLQHGDMDTALVYAFGKSSTGDIRDVLAAQLDPYTLAPLGPDPIALAALQARAYLDATGATERRFAEVAARSRRDAKENPFAQVKGDFDVDAILAAPYIASPLRKHDCPPISDGAAAVILAAGDRARALSSRPIWIRGIDHRMEPQALGLRDLARSPSTEKAASRAAEMAEFRASETDIAELLAPFTPQELILRDALGLGARTRINPSGGALASNPVMVAGLIRLGEAAARIHDGRAKRALAHATSGPCLQHNLVCLMEAT